jgi:hypothetical protein
VYFSLHLFTSVYICLHLFTSVYISVHLNFRNVECNGTELTGAVQSGGGIPNCLIVAGYWMELKEDLPRDFKIG